MHLRSLVASVLFAAATSLGCNFIMNPEGDGVFRCDNPDDCDVPLAAALGDERTQSRCGAGGGGGGGGFTESQDNKVCSVVDREDVTCDPNALKDLEVPFADVYTDAVAQSGVYATCPPDDYGTAGCPPAGGTCGAGLTVRSYETLSGDESNPGLETVEVCSPDGDSAALPNSALRGFDVLDQHCRSFFCDEDFVCNRGSGTSSGWRCVRCDPDRPYGNGGCGTLYLQGAPSTVYTDDLGSACEDKASIDKTDFGPVVKAPATP